LRTDRTAGSVEVMMAGAADIDKGSGGENNAPTKSACPAKPALERDENIAGTSNVLPVATLLQAAMNVMSTSIAPNADAAATQAELVAWRQALLHGAADVSRAQQELNITLREYNAAHGFASVSIDPARVAATRLRGHNLDKELRREVHSGKSMSVSLSLAENPKYSTPDKTLRAARAAVEACESLSGDALAKQQAQVKELLLWLLNKLQRLPGASKVPAHLKSFIRL
jgi:hypothetical protein